MAKYLWHFETHHVEVWDNVYLDILTESDKEILEYLWNCKTFWKEFDHFDNLPKSLYFIEISDEEADIISKYVTYCKSCFEFIYNWLDDLYYQTNNKLPESEEYTLEQVKLLVNDN